MGRRLMAPRQSFKTIPALVQRGRRVVRVKAAAGINSAGRHASRSGIHHVVNTIPLEIKIKTRSIEFNPASLVHNFLQAQRAQGRYA